MTSSFDPEGREAALLDSITDFDGGRILEIGIGDGRMTWEYAGRAASVVGVDPDVESLQALLEDRTGPGRSQVFPVCSESESLPFPSERFDAAILAWSL